MELTDFPVAPALTVGYTPLQVANMLGCDVGTVRKAIWSGELPAFRRPSPSGELQPIQPRFLVSRKQFAEYKRRRAERKAATETAAPASTEAPAPSASVDLDALAALVAEKLAAHLAGIVEAAVSDLRASVAELHELLK